MWLDRMTLVQYLIEYWNIYRKHIPLSETHTWLIAAYYINLFKLGSNSDLIWWLHKNLPDWFQQSSHYKQWFQSVLYFFITICLTLKWTNVTIGSLTIAWYFYGKWSCWTKIALGWITAQIFLKEFTWCMYSIKRMFI